MASDNRLSERIKTYRREFLGTLGALAGAGTAASVSSPETDDTDRVALGGAVNGKLTDQYARQQYITSNAASFDPGDLREGELAWVDDGRFGVKQESGGVEAFPVGSSGSPVPAVHTDDATINNSLDTVAFNHDLTDGTDVSGSRSVDTAYQNTTGNALLVRIVVKASGGSPNAISRALEVAPASGDLNQVNEQDRIAGFENSNRIDYMFKGVVPDGYYYRLADKSGNTFDDNGSIIRWMEREFNAN